MEDRQMITDLVSEYNLLIDHLEAEPWARTFTHDGSLIVNGVERAQGTEALIRYVTKRSEMGVPALRHWVNNLLVTGNRNAARLRGYVMAFKVDGELGAPHVMGEYEDDLLKVGNVWKFRIRRMTVVAGRTLSS
jgi:hypothetical protein